MEQMFHCDETTRPYKVLPKYRVRRGTLVTEGRSAAD